MVPGVRVQVPAGQNMSAARVFGHDLESASNSLVKPIVFVVDGDVGVRESLDLLIRREGWKPETFASTQEFLNRPQPFVPSCIVLDVSIPGFHGIELQKQIAAERGNTPIICITSRRDVSMTVQAMKAGALEFLTKPFDDDDLLNGIREALQRSRVILVHEAEMQTLLDRYASLTRREREVLALVTSGFLNKQVGGTLGISEITVKAHRGQVMVKMKADSLAGLVRMAARLDLPDPRSCSDHYSFATRHPVQSRPNENTHRLYRSRPSKPDPSFKSIAIL
jgi:FixJ family two-component response regulator